MSTSIDLTVEEVVVIDLTVEGSDIAIDISVNPESEGGGGAAWGDISGDIEDQTDLQEALSEKANTEDIPSALSELSDDATHRLVTDTEKGTWNGKADPEDIPSALSELSDDETHRLVTDTEKNTWDGKETAGVCIAKAAGVTYTVNAVKCLTAAEYAALTPGPDANTIYFIV